MKYYHLDGLRHFKLILSEAEFTIFSETCSSRPTLWSVSWCWTPLFIYALGQDFGGSLGLFILPHASSSHSPPKNLWYLALSYLSPCQSLTSLGSYWALPLDISFLTGLFINFLPLKLINIITNNFFPTNFYYYYYGKIHIKSTILTCTIRWHPVDSHCCAVITTVHL